MSPPATLYHGISQLVLPHLEEGNTLSPLDVVEDGALLVVNETILASGPLTEVQTHPQALQATRISLQNKAVIPGLVDSHTHTVFAGDRMDEMAMRARGDTYEAIAQAGGGIVRSVNALEQCSPEELVQAASKRIQHMKSLGVTTLEIKSGYGLSAELEAKQLDAIESLAQSEQLSIVGTLLAHVIPKDRRDNREDYVSEFCSTILPNAAERDAIHYCDVFVESGAFTPEETTRIAQRAKELGLRIKLHVDQLHDGNGASLAASLGALSADHLEKTNEDGAKALAEAKTVATILPGCGLFLGGENWPNGRALRDAGCTVAVATDCNPGSSMVMDLPLCGTMAATQCGLTLEEALWGITRGGAQALGFSDRGTLRAGERADFVILDHVNWKSLFYSPAATPVHQVIIGGMTVVK